MNEADHGAGRLAQIRSDFDSGFAALPAEAGAATEKLLAIRVGGDPYALKVREITGLVGDRKVTPLPGPLPELAGIAGVRGVLVCVYSLAALLEYPAEGESLRWLALSDLPWQTGLAFSELERFIDVPRDALHVADASESRRAHIREVVTLGDQNRLVISVASVMESIRRKIEARAR